MEQVAIVGSSGHAAVILDIVRCAQRFEVVGLIDPVRAIGEQVGDLPVLGSESDLPACIERHAISAILVAIGDNHTRAEVSARIAARCPGLRFAAAVHPRAVVAADASIGPGTVVMAGAVINPRARVGAGCIVNTRASLDHDSRMEPFSSLAPGVATGGNCHIGEQTAVGIGAVLSHGVNVGAHCVIGAGAVVLDDVNPRRVAFGTPAVEVRRREPGEPYL